MVLFLAGILVGIALMCAAIAISTLLDGTGGGDSGDEKAEAMRRIHMETERRIDKTADYYVGLFRFIDDTLGEQARPRRSSPRSREATRPG